MKNISVGNFKPKMVLFYNDTLLSLCVKIKLSWKISEDEYNMITTVDLLKKNQIKSTS